MCMIHFPSTLLEGFVHLVPMPKSKPTDILKQFAKLQKQAEQRGLTANKAIEKKIAKEVAAVHKTYVLELTEFDPVLSYTHYQFN
jgi:hypothetical protein